MITIIADDFTGSCDTGIQFLGDCDEPVVAIKSPIGKAFSENEPLVLVVDTESRHMSEDDARACVAATVTELRARAVGTFFKKIDSTLRGNLGAETDAMMDALGYDYAFVIPATPENGRTVRDGKCYIDGIELSKTEFGRDPFSPVASSSVPLVIARQSRRRVGKIGLESVRGDPALFASDIRAELAKGPGIIIFDSLTIKDIERIVVVGKGILDRCLYVGASGLGKVLSGFSSLKMKLSIRNARTLFVVGSIKEVSCRQVEYLLTHASSVRAVDLDVDRLLRDKESTLRGITEKALSMAPDVDIVVRVMSGPDKHELSVEYPRDRAEFIADVLGEIARDLLAAGIFENLFVTGGDTAYSVVRGLEGYRISLMAEMLPGIPVCAVRSLESGRAFTMITKAGGFGGEETLHRILNTIRAGDQRNQGNNNE